MRDSTVRLLRIKIQNFKNVICGDIDFTNPSRNGCKASVLGLYGQNGSGKTALIDAIQLLKFAMMGRTIPSEFVNYVNVDAEWAALQFEFELKAEDNKYIVSYEFRIKKEEPLPDTLPQVGQDNEDQVKLVLFDEFLSYVKDGIKSSEMVIDSRGEEFLNWLGEKFVTDLTVAKRIALRSSMSLLFSWELKGILKKEQEMGRRYDVQRLVDILDRFVFYATFELFAVSSMDFKMLGKNVLYAAGRLKGKDKSVITITFLPIVIDKTFPVSRSELNFMLSGIKKMNIVLSQLVPGLELGVKEMEPSVSLNGDEVVRIQLMSHRDGRDIPFIYESEGIKKIVSVLQLLIAVYNKESITVAIDELDSGVFEYLLGEILKIISEQGEGQLIFTSHNLRPLETLDKGFVAFTTINPSRRYTRIAGMKENQNLRDFYFRDIVLGGQEEPLYEPTNNAEIALAFREAWGYGE